MRHHLSRGSGACWKNSKVQAVWRCDSDPSGLRDRSGVVQLVLDPAAESGAAELGHRVRDEWVVRATGTVRARPEGMRNPRLATGDVEIAVT
ncbi:hypothetical protein EBU58_09385, partial [bacterium]|nr:hypothetical protein [bacterium]